MSSFAKLAICILIITAGISFSSDTGHALSPADANTPKDSNGPTIFLGYSKQDLKENPIESFMYFIPLISSTPVEVYTSANNRQQVGIISYLKTIDSKSFNLICEFEILGNGFHKSTFEPAGVIALYIGELKKGETLTNMLDYIKFEGPGFGIIEVSGSISNSVPIVTEVDLQFNARGLKSPVTVGLYDIEPNDGQYKYENRSNQVVARVNRLIFKKTDAIPHMGIKVASLSTDETTEGFMSRLKGTIANLFLRPPPVTKLGNQTMLDFGHALFQQKPSFTFPIAKNIKETKSVSANER